MGFLTGKTAIITGAGYAVLSDGRGQRRQKSLFGKTRSRIRRLASVAVSGNACGNARARRELIPGFIL